MEYKRLTSGAKCKGGLFDRLMFEDNKVIDLVNRLAELEDKIEQGTLIELPCKVGDKFYGICGFVIFEYTTLAIKLVKDHKICLCTIYDMEYVLGKDAFLTLEDAEKRFKELQNG